MARIGRSFPNRPHLFQGALPAAGTATANAGLAAATGTSQAPVPEVIPGAGLASATGTSEFTPGTQVSLTLTELQPVSATGTAQFTPGTEVSLTLVEVLPVTATGAALTPVLRAWGPFNIWLPGGYVYFGTPVAVLPPLKVTLQGTAGKFGPLTVRLPKPAVAPSGRYFRSVLPRPGVALAGHVTHFHSGSLAISLSRYSGMTGHFLFRLLQRQELAPPASDWAAGPELAAGPDLADWAAGQPKTGWKAGLAWEAWNVGASSTVSVSHLATQYVLVPVSAVKNGAPYNPTSDPVQFAFAPTPTYVPQPADWVSGSWVTVAGSVIYPYSAQCLVGSGGVITLGIGSYIMYIRISDSPETPVLLAGQLQVS